MNSKIGTTYYKQYTINFITSSSQDCMDKIYVAIALLH